MGKVLSGQLSCPCDRSCFWPGLGLPRPKAIVVIPKKLTLAKVFTEKKRVKVRSTTGHYATKKRPVKITMYFGLNFIIKLKFTTNFDRCAILKVLKGLLHYFSTFSGHIPDKQIFMRKTDC